MVEHITSVQYISCFLGIFLFWVIAYGSDKEDLDNASIKFNYNHWLKYFFWDRHDDIIVHMVVSFVALFMGEANFKVLASKILTELPEASNEAGTAFIIGISGSFLGTGLKKIYRKIRTEKFILKYEEYAGINRGKKNQAK